MSGFSHHIRYIAYIWFLCLSTTYFKYSCYKFFSWYIFLPQYFRVISLAIEIQRKNLAKGRNILANFIVIALSNTEEFWDFWWFWSKNHKLFNGFFWLGSHNYHLPTWKAKFNGFWKKILYSDPSDTAFDFFFKCRV